MYCTVLRYTVQYCTYSTVLYSQYCDDSTALYMHCHYSTVLYCMCCSVPCLLDGAYCNLCHCALRQHTAPSLLHCQTKRALKLRTVRRCRNQREGTSPRHAAAACEQPPAKTGEEILYCTEQVQPKPASDARLLYCSRSHGSGNNRRRQPTSAWTPWLPCLRRRSHRTSSPTTCRICTVQYCTVSQTYCTIQFCWTYQVLYCTLLC